MREQIQVAEAFIKFYYNCFEMEIEEQESPTPNCSLPQRNRFHFSEPREASIYFNSQFDSGNMLRVARTAYDHYSVWTASDAQGTENEGYPKSWFYFQVGGFTNRRVSFSVHRVHFLFAMTKREHMYLPVYRIRYDNGEVSQWDRLPYPILSLALNQDDELVLKFDFMFSKLIASVEFAFTYPYSYQEYRTDVLALKEQYQNDRQLFFGHYELTKSYEGRSVDFLIISSHEGKEGFQVTKGVPFSQQKITRFRSNKPIIFISSRVHPIETPSSYCMNGIIQFLLNKKDTRAHLLRKYFVFVLVPMLNPDGVSRGHCRMDSLNQNLNRYYTAPDPQKQPSCFAVKKLCEHYSRDKRLFMYLDLHAHPAFKGNFIFGNAIYQFVEQVESQLFPKVLSQNCINFEFQQCIFSRKHMKAKDRNEEISKEGCGRVVFYKEFGLVHSYTLECGYHMNSFDNALQPSKCTDSKLIVKYKLSEKGEKLYESGQRMLDEEKLGKYIEEASTKEDEKARQFDVFEYTSDCLDEKENEYYKKEIPTYSQETFYNLGRNILISILDIWNKNPFSRLTDMNADRRDIAERQSKLDRFRKEQAGIKAKQKKIVQLIEEQLYGEWHRRNVFNPVLLINPAQRDKKRNHTLQIQKMTIIRQQKSEKSEKLVIKGEQVKEAKALINSETLPEGEGGSQIKITSIGHSHGEKGNSTNSEGVIENRLYNSKNFKVGRGKQTSSANQGDKESCRGPSINKQLLATQVKVNLEEQLMRVQKHEGLSLSSKVIKNSCFNMNMRVRNVAVNGIGGVMAPAKK